MAKIKFVFFDMEGTLFKKVVKVSDTGRVAPSAWILLAQHLGEDCFKEEQATHKKWNEGGYAGYVEWMRETIEIYQKYGLKRDFFDKLMAGIAYHPGVQETFAALRERGYEFALISGGFKAQADRAIVDLKINHSFAACELFWKDDGTIAHWNLLPCDYEGKRDFMELIMKEHGLKPEECAFVGDGKNDIPFAQAVGISIAFNSPQELQDVCTHAINQPEGQEDFKAILEFL